MPALSGLELARGIRAVCPSLPIVLASGYVTDTLRAEAPAAGVTVLLYKEDAVERFCEAIQHVILSQRDGLKMDMVESSPERPTL